jgi:methylphosphotriester-DNA--protein-cysteine methyltransferase
MAYALIGRDGKPRESKSPGKLGGHRRTHIYGRLDCPAALRAIARGGYIEHRVFFRDATVARDAGYRPCAVCLPKEYARWKSRAKPKAVTPRRAG